MELMKKIYLAATRQDKNAPCTKGNCSRTDKLYIYYENTPIFHNCNNDNIRLKFFDYFHIFAQNIVCGYTLESEAVLPSTHNLCFSAKIRK